MKYNLTSPCADCPFLAEHEHAYSETRLEMLASGEFPCHKTATLDEEKGFFVENEESSHCAGALIYLEKRDRPQQMMRIAERLGMYDRFRLKMDSPVL